MPVPQPGDDIWVARKNGDVIEAFYRAGSGPIVDISGEVGAVDLTSESIHVTGKRIFPTVEPWSVSCDRDPESTEDMLRGTVRAAVQATAPLRMWSGESWSDVCAKRVQRNMDTLGLSPRERDVVGRVFTGESNAEIARALYIQTGTVRNYLTSVYQHAGVTGLAGCARSALIVKLLDVERIELGD